MSAQVPAILTRFRARQTSAEVALMELLIELEDAAQVAEAIADEPALCALLLRNATGVTQIAAMLRSGMDSDEPAPTIEAGIARARRLFDWSVQQSEEASVALYSLGSAQVLTRATDEIVALYRARGWLTTTRAILQIGCGIGRLEQTLAPFVREAHGIDVAPQMIEVARRRCAGLSNVTLAVCDGRDLRMYRDARFELVHAIDSFPYLAQAGAQLVEAHFREVARVLQLGGDFVIGNFTYRDDLARDRDDVTRLAAAAGLLVVTAGERPFALWDGALFHLRKPMSA